MKTFILSRMVQVVGFGGGGRSPHQLALTKLGQALRVLGEAPQGHPALFLSSDLDFPPLPSTAGVKLPVRLREK